jgi:MinD-like ATPase involved in chromosome partitioning or flagellar assembly
MKTINFYSYKGGVGRTMLAAQIARSLAALGKKVVVADFDFDAPGVPAVFGQKLKDARGGLLELVMKFENINKPTDEFNERLADYLCEVPIQLNRGGMGEIQILPSGRVCYEDDEDKNRYWDTISDIRWLELLSTPEHKQSSFVRFVLRVLKPALEERGFDYLLIDARAGITYYGTIARYVADRQAMIFCPNEEAKDALEQFLLPKLIKFQKERKTYYVWDNELHPTPMDRLVFVVSRMPPELNVEKKKVFKKMKELIDRGLPDETSTYRAILKLHSDLETQLYQGARVLDERFKSEEEQTRKENVVQIHEDIFKILAALCFEEVPPAAQAESLRGQANALWCKIFDENLTITYENRLFGFLNSGEMRNPDDKQRNVAFKVVTFLTFLNEFYKTLNEQFKDHPSGEEKCVQVTNEAFSNSGVQCGNAFGKAFVKQLEENGIFDKREQIEHWCAFDTRAGFGIMDYDDSKKIIKIENPFILDSATTDGRDYTAFFTGYVVGVLIALLGKDELTGLDMKILEKDVDIDNQNWNEKVYSKKRVIGKEFVSGIQYSDNLKSTTEDYGILYKFKVVSLW